MRAGRVVVIGAVVVVAAVVVGMGSLLGLRSTGVVSTAESGRARSETAAATTEQFEEETNDREVQREVVLEAFPTDEIGDPAQVIAGLGDGVVLRVTVAGAEPGAGEQVRQCINGVLDWFERCVNSLPVTFDADGRATFQYQLVDPLECGALGSCALVVGDQNGPWIAYAYTVFGAVAPPSPIVTLTPSGPYDPGESLMANVTGMLPGAPISTWFCAVECGDPVAGVADNTGNRSVTLRVGDRCTQCTIVVVAGVREVMARVTVNTGSGATYTPSRLLAGVIAMFGFLVATLLIIRRTEWRPPSEAATPEFDQPWRWNDGDGSVT